MDATELEEALDPEPHSRAILPTDARRLGAMRANGERCRWSSSRAPARPRRSAASGWRGACGRLLGARPEALPENFGPRELRPAEESAVAATRLDRACFAVVDLETTGLSSERDAIIEIGAVRVRERSIASRFETLVRPPGPGPLSAAIVRLTGIDDAMLAPAPAAHRALAIFARWLAEARGAPWVAHNAHFDSSFLRRAFERQWGRAPAVAVLCTQR